MSHDTEYSAPIKCTHCANTAPMVIAEKLSQVVSQEDETTGYPWASGPIYELLTCPACQGVSLRRYYWHDQMEPDDVGYEFLYPTPSRATEPPGLPPIILQEYRAAMQVRTISANAYGVLLGRLLELVCDDRGAKGGSLSIRLKKLSENGEIPGKLVQIAEKLQELRHVGAHAWVGGLTPAEVPILDSLCRAILEYVYTAPLLVSDATERLAALRSQQRKKKQRSGGSQKND